jgi:hypothetical protein
MWLGEIRDRFVRKSGMWKSTERRGSVRFVRAPAAVAG